MDREVPVQEVMDRAFVGVSESDGVQETSELMIEEGVESVVVLRGREPVGVLTERDVLKQVVEGDVTSATVADAMNESVPTVRPDATLTEAVSELSAQSTQRLVVTNGGEPMGLVTEHDLLETAPLQQGSPAEEPKQATRTTAVPAGGTAEMVDRSIEDGFDDQSICEACGTFARDLATFNGQMLCADCRDI